MKPAVLGSAALLGALLSAVAAASPADEPSIFKRPAQAMEQQMLQMQIQQLFLQQQYYRAEQVIAAAIQQNPRSAVNHYNLACAQSRQGRIEAALDSLVLAISNGFVNVNALRTDADLDRVRGSARFAAVLDRAQKQAGDTVPRAADHFALQPIGDGVALVTESNTLWDMQFSAYRTMFAIPAFTRSAAEIVKGQGKAGDLVRAWWQEGGAAGLDGILYDNHDDGHMVLDCENFPQLTRIQFCAEAREMRLHTGVQASFLFNLPTIGNSSTAVGEGAFWRSSPRIAMVDAQRMNVLYLQYIGNHLYFYPEHKDYDPGHNGKDGGYGDVFPANIPYVITAQGSSGSELPMMRAVACTLAAFRPETRQALVLSGTLAPALQMIFRSSNRQVGKPADYLTGAAHPAVFNSADLSPEKMVTLAHAMKAEDIPPVVQLRVEMEQEGVAGVDYFHPANREKLFDTPSAIARVFRTTDYYYRMVVSAENSRDPNGRPLTYRWAVLCGDRAGIRITPLNAAGSIVELRIPYQGRHRVQPDLPIECNRVDIGAFVHNGTYYSAPGFISFYCLDNERRVYDRELRIQSVEYQSREKNGNYADPVIDLPKDWRDEYRYDPRGWLMGWTRSRGEVKEEFTADGALVLEKDPQGRPLRARMIQYVMDVPVPQQPGVLKQVPTDVVVQYGYANDSDAMGYIISRMQERDAGRRESGAQGVRP